MAETLIGSRSHTEITLEQIRDFHFARLQAASYDDVRVHDIIRGLSSTRREAYDIALSSLTVQVANLGRRTLESTLEFFTSREVEFEEPETTVEQSVGALSLQDEIDLILSPEPQVA